MKNMVLLLLLDAFCQSFSTELSAVKTKYVGYKGKIYNKRFPSTIKVTATPSVSQDVHDKAVKHIERMVKHMPAYIFRAVADNGSGVGIFSRNEKITVFPENYLLKNKANCGRSCSGSCVSTCTSDGRKLEDLDGVTNTLSAVREDKIMCSNGPDAENVLVHEFAHQVYNYMPDEDHESIQEIYNHAKQHWIWSADSYAMSNPTEYWAEATQAFFHVTNRTDVTGGLNMCNFGQYVCRTESEGRKHIQSRDPLLFDFLSKIYTNNQPNIPSGLTTC